MDAPRVFPLCMSGRLAAGVGFVKQMDLHGEIHAICGENGAGKSTLMKVLIGVYPHGTYGEIVYEGQEVRFGDIRASEQAGIVIIHQEIALVPGMSITENVFLGNEPRRRGAIDWRTAQRRVIELMAQVGLEEDPDTLTRERRG
ncbi:ATP-binding cassette domain-containing protein [Nocardia sp. CA-107356]|uniref:ATP-binding cassette domain-containing protein n=1 Tax=Nocardia sp. CA-107356 TaxID=3239972 RepID=UPI003D8C1325